MLAPASSIWRTRPIEMLAFVMSYEKLLPHSTYDRRSLYIQAYISRPPLAYQGVW